MKDNPSTVGLGFDRIVTLLTESSSSKYYPISSG